MIAFNLKGGKMARKRKKEESGCKVKKCEAQVAMKCRQCGATTFVPGERVCKGVQCARTVFINECGKCGDSKTEAESNLISDSGKKPPADNDARKDEKFNPAEWLELL